MRSTSVLCSALTATASSTATAISPFLFLTKIEETIIKEMARDYNPKYGYGSSGRVGKDDLSFDGKSWNYRDPSNFVGKRPGQTRPGANYGDDDYNPNAYEMFDPLYDYAYGDVRDAADALGIGNYNKKDEVARTVEYLQNRSKQQEDATEEPAPEPEPEPAPVTTAQDYALSPTLQSALDFEKKYEAGLASGALNPFREGYRAAADEVAESFLSDYTSDLLDLSRRSMTA